MSWKLLGASGIVCAALVAASAADTERRHEEHAGVLAQADRDPPDRDLPDRDLPDQDLPDRDLPDRDLLDRDLPDRDLSDRDLPSGDEE